MTLCLTPGCDRELTPQDRRGRCDPCYQRRRRMGLYGWVHDTTEVRARLERLRERGWTWLQIADVAGVDGATPRRIATGRTLRLWRETAQALMAVPVTDPPDSRRGIDSTGSRRRVQALAWMGWTAEEVARRAGTTKSTLQTEILPSRRISVTLAHRISTVYDELCMRPGPSRRAAAKARALGHVPPLAWDEDTLDDPAARPDFGELLPRAVALAENSDELLRQGYTLPQIAERLGVSKSGLVKARQRAGGAAA